VNRPSSPRDRRYFNAAEHKALYLASDGLCECTGCDACGPGGCGVPLEPGWHADHDKPHSRGGRTHVSNGLAKCPPCNQSKGDSMISVTLLPWQEDAVNRYVTAGIPPRFLLAAVPGGGKTKTAAAIAEKVGRFTVVLVPQADIVSDWRADLHARGICTADVRKGKDGRSLSIGTVCPSCGQAATALVMTYLFSAANPEILCKVMRDRGPVLLILDEIHHLRDGGATLEPIQTAWPFAGEGSRKVCVLGLSGTPFRTDEEPVPFIHTPGPFKDERAMIPDDWVVDYSYGKAVSDRPAAVTQVIFERFGGDVEWEEKQDDGTKVEKSARWRGNHGKDTARKVRRHGVDPRGDWLRKVLVAADAKAEELRAAGDPHPGALVVCRNTDHAVDTADILATIHRRPVFVYTESYSTCRHRRGGGKINERTGEREGNQIAVRLGDGSDGSVLDAYKESDAVWLVTVRKVSEGVSVPRLRVLVYAAVIRTWLFFMQVLGRVIRINRNLSKTADQTAWVFIPDEEEITNFASEIEQQAAAALVQDALIDDDDLSDDGQRTIACGPGGGASGRGRDQFLRSDAEYAGATYAGEMHDADFMEIVRLTNRPEAEAIPVVRALAEQGLLNVGTTREQATGNAAAVRQPEDPHKQRDRAVKKLREVTKSWAGVRLRAREFRSIGDAARECNREVGREFGVWAENPDITLEQALKATAWVQERMKDAYIARWGDDALPF
jgi:superfamily II DNA or RNA helicase